LPLHDLVRAAMANTPGISAEVEVFGAELKALGPDGAAERIKSVTTAWAAAL
jgi:hypothetical protein